MWWVNNYRFSMRRHIPSPDDKGHIVFPSATSSTSAHAPPTWTYASISHFPDRSFHPDKTDGCLISCLWYRRFGCDMRRVSTHCLRRNCGPSWAIRFDPAESGPDMRFLSNRLGASRRSHDWRLHPAWAVLGFYKWEMLAIRAGLTAIKNSPCMRRRTGRALEHVCPGTVEEYQFVRRSLVRNEIDRSPVTPATEAWAEVENAELRCSDVRRR